MDLGGALLGFVVLGQLLGAGQTTSPLLTIGGVVVVAFQLTVALVREPSQSAAPGSGRVTLVTAFEPASRALVAALQKGESHAESRRAEAGHRPG